MESSKAIALINHRSLHTGSITTWADLGCGDGFFTKVLSTFLQEGSTIYAMDNNVSALKKVKLTAGITAKPLQLNFIEDSWPFEKLDGIMMANSLHYVKQKEFFLNKTKKHLKDEGILLMIEYDTERSNPWVPYPVSYTSLQMLLTHAAFNPVIKLNEIPSAFGRTNMYAAISSIHQV